MKLIKSLIDIKNKKVKLNDSDQTALMLQQLEELVLAFPEKQDEELASILYGGKYNKSTFKSLKYRLEEKLLNELFANISFDPSALNRSQSKVVLEKLYTCATFFYKTLQRDPAINLMKRCYKYAKYFSHTELILLCSKNLLNHYAFTDINKVKMEQYLSVFDEYSKVFLAEKVVERNNAVISNIYVKNQGIPNKADIELIKTLVQEVNEINEKHSTNVILIYNYDLTFYYATLIADFEYGLKIALEGLEKFEALPNQERLGLQISYRNIAMAHFYLAKYEEASYWFERALSLLTNGSRIWFFINSSYFDNAIHCDDYEKAFRIYLTVIHSKQLNKFWFFEELWDIRSAYLHLLIKLKKIEKEKVSYEELPTFSQSKFMNSVPFHNKDKKGNNVSILLVQILHLLAEAKYNKIIDKIDALNQYSVRYLRNDSTFRSNCLFKMISNMSKAGFHPKRTLAYNKELIIKLKKSNMIYTDNAEFFEIIPYEKLWDLIVEILERNHLKPKS